MSFTVAKINAFNQPCYIHRITTAQSIFKYNRYKNNRIRYINTSKRNRI